MPNIIVTVRQALQHECTVPEIRNKLKLSSKVKDSDSNKYKRGYRYGYGEVWRGLRMERDWSQAVVSAEIFSHSEYVFTLVTQKKLL
jgi:hypothetical protein